MATDVKSFRERRKPFEHTTKAGEVFTLRPVSLLSLIAAGAVPGKLQATAAEIAGLSAEAKDGRDDFQGYIAMIDRVLLKGVVSPKVAEKGTDDAIGLEEIDDATKVELFEAIMARSQTLSGEEGETDLEPFPEKPAGGGARKGGGKVRPETERDGGDRA